MLSDNCAIFYSRVRCGSKIRLIEVISKIFRNITHPEEYANRMRGENRIKTVPDQKFCGMEEATPALSLRNGSYFLFFRGIPLDNRGKKWYISRYGDPAGLLCDFSKNRGFAVFNSLVTALDHGTVAGKSVQAATGTAHVADGTVLLKDHVTDFASTGAGASKEAVLDDQGTGNTM